MAGGANGGGGIGQLRLSLFKELGVKTISQGGGDDDKESPVEIGGKAKTVVAGVEIFSLSGESVDSFVSVFKIF